MKCTPYAVAAVILGTITAVTLGAGTSVAQTGAEADQSPIPTPAKYDIGASANFEVAVQRLAEQGFDVIELETEGKRIEVTGMTSTGHCLELKFHPVSGKETRRKRDDDCGARLTN